MGVVFAKRRVDFLGGMCGNWGCEIFGSYGGSEGEVGGERFDGGGGALSGFVRREQVVVFAGGGGAAAGSGGDRGDAGFGE